MTRKILLVPALLIALAISDSTFISPLIASGGSGGGTTPSESAAWLAQRDASPVTQKVRPHMRHAPGSPGIYVKTFPR